MKQPLTASNDNKSVYGSTQLQSQPKHSSVPAQAQQIIAHSKPTSQTVNNQQKNSRISSDSDIPTANLRPQPAPLNILTESSAAPPHTSTSSVVEQVSDSEWEDSVILRDGRRYPSAQKEKHITLFHLVAIIFFCVVNGPYGLEDAVAHIGGAYTIVVLIASFVLIHLPTGLLTSELAAAMPQNGGYILWVARAFGNFSGFMEGFLSWSASLVDTAIYPLFCTAYLEWVVVWFGYVIPDPARLCIRCAFVGVCLIANICDWQINGIASLVFAAATILPFFALSLMGFMNTEIPTIIDSLLRSTHVHQFHLGIALSCILWVGSGWDSPGSVAGDVHRPKQTYPRAVILSIFLVAVTNVLPLLIALTDTNLNDYNALHAYWAQLALSVGGHILCISIVLTGIIGNSSLFSVLLTSSSWSLYALALPGLWEWETLTQLHVHYRTPYICMIINVIAVAICCFSDFVSLVQVAMVLNGLALSLQFAALCWLRVSEPKMKRPYKIPLNTPALILFSLPHWIITLFLLVTVDRIAQVVVLITVLFGISSYPFARYLARHRVSIVTLASSTTVESQSFKNQGEVSDNINLTEVFEDMTDNITSLHTDEQSRDVFPSVGLRSAIQAESLPEQLLRGGMTETSGSEASDDTDGDEGSPIMIRSPKRTPVNRVTFSNDSGGRRGSDAYDSYTNAIGHTDETNPNSDRSIHSHRYGPSLPSVNEQSRNNGKKKADW